MSAAVVGNHVVEDLLVAVGMFGSWYTRTTYAPKAVNSVIEIDGVRQPQQVLKKMISKEILYVRYWSICEHFYFFSNSSRIRSMCNAECGKTTNTAPITLSQKVDGAIRSRIIPI